MISAACRGVLRARRALLLGALIAGGALVFVSSAFAASVTLSPNSQEQTIAGTPSGPFGAAAGTDAKLSAVESGCGAAAGNTVTFSVFAGPNAGLIGSAVTDGTGTATFEYPGSVSGADSVRASMVCAGSKVTIGSNIATVLWDNGIDNYFPGIVLSSSGSFCGVGCVSGVPQGVSTSYLSTIDFCDDNADAAPVVISHAADYTVVWNWGDGTTSNATATVDGGCFDSSNTHTYAHAGTYNVTETVTDTDNPTNTVSGPEGTITVVGITGTGIPFSTQEGTTFSGPTASFTDTNTGDTASQFTATINWGDGTTTPASVSGTTGGPFTVSGSHAYVEDGSYTVTSNLCQLVAMIQQCQSATSTATVTESTVTATGVGTVSTGSSFSGTVATFTDPNTLEGPASHYSAVINWGDGTPTSTGTVSGSAGSYTVTGSHTFASSGAHTVSVQIKDDGVNNGAPATSTFNVSAEQNITGSGNNLTGTEGFPLSGFVVANIPVVAQFNDPANDGATDYTATVSWGDGSSNTVTPNNLGGGNFNVKVDHTYAEEGSYTVHVTITDTDTPSNTITTTATATIGDAALSASGVGTVRQASLTFSGTVATFTDNNPFATTADFTATINWGDGTTSAGTVSGPTGGPFTVSGTHTYASGGVLRTVTVNVNDDGGSTASATSSIGVGCGIGTKC